MREVLSILVNIKLKKIDSFLILFNEFHYIFFRGGITIIVSIFKSNDMLLSS